MDMETVGYWAVGNRPYPEKIYQDPKTGALMIFDDINKAEKAAAGMKNSLGVAVVFSIGITVR